MFLERVFPGPFVSGPERPPPTTKKDNGSVSIVECALVVLVLESSHQHSTFYSEHYGQYLLVVFFYISTFTQIYDVKDDYIH